MNVFRRLWNSAIQHLPFKKKTKTADVAQKYFPSSPPSASSSPRISHAHSLPQKSSRSVSASSLSETSGDESTLPSYTSTKQSLSQESTHRLVEEDSDDESGSAPSPFVLPGNSRRLTLTFSSIESPRAQISKWDLTRAEKVALSRFFERLDDNPVQTIYRHDDETIPVRPPRTVYIDREKGIITINPKQWLGQGSSSTTKRAYALNSIPLAMSTSQKNPKEPLTPEQYRLKNEKIVRISALLKDVPHVLHYRLGASYPGRDLREKTPLFSEAMAGDFATIEQETHLFSNDSLSFSEQLEIAIGLAKGLAEMHRRGVVHNDFKPNNLFLRRENGKWVPYIGDYDLSFEIANEVERNDLRKAGSAGYASPEKITEQIPPGQFEKGDLYSLGIILEWLFSGGYTSVFDLQTGYITGLVPIENYIHEVQALPQLIREDTNSPYFETGIWSVISQLYTANPVERPSAEQIVHALEALRATPP